MKTINEWIKPPNIEPITVESRDPTDESTVTPTKAQEQKTARKKALQAHVGIIARAASKLQDSFDNVSGKLIHGATIPTVTQDAVTVLDSKAMIDKDNSESAGYTTVPTKKRRDKSVTSNSEHDNQPTTGIPMKSETPSQIQTALRTLPLRTWGFDEDDDNDDGVMDVTP